MKDWIKLLVVAGLTLIIVNHIVKGWEPKTRVVYKYLPKDLDDALRAQPYPSVMYADMFDMDKNKWSAPRYPG